MKEWLLIAATIHDREHRRQMSAIGVFDDAPGAQRFPAGPAKLALLPSCEHRLALRLAEHHARPLKELESVILRRIVRSRNLNSPGGLPLTDQPADRGRGRRPGAEDIVPGRHDARFDGGGENGGRNSSIMAEHDRPRLAATGVRRRKLDRNRRIEPVADHTSQT